MCNPSDMLMKHIHKKPVWLFYFSIVHKSTDEFKHKFISSFT